MNVPWLNTKKSLCQRVHISVMVNTHTHNIYQHGNEYLSSIKMRLSQFQHDQNCAYCMIMNTHQAWHLIHNKHDNEYTSMTMNTQQAWQWIYNMYDNEYTSSMTITNYKPHLFIHSMAMSTQSPWKWRHIWHENKYTPSMSLSTHTAEQRTHNQHDIGIVTTCPA